jgi:hypothetical protein
MSGLITDEWRAVKEYFGSINNFCLLAVDAEYGESVARVSGVYNVRFPIDSPSLREEVDLCLSRDPEVVLVAGLQRHFNAVSVRLKERGYSGILFGFRPTLAKPISGLRVVSSDCPDDCYFSEAYEATKIMVRGLLSDKPFSEWMKQSFVTRLGLLNFNSNGDTSQIFKIHELN